MSKKLSSRSGLFLLELIISILFFSVASAVCLQLFVKAHLLDKDNQALTHSVKQCENFAEVFTSVNGDVNAFYPIYPDAQIKAGDPYGQQSFCLYFDEDFQSCPGENASYRMGALFSKEETSSGILYHATVYVCAVEDQVYDAETLDDINNINIIYSIPVCVYVSNRGGNHYEE